MIESFIAGFQWAAAWCFWLSGAFTGFFLLVFSISLLFGLLGLILIQMGLAPKKEEKTATEATDKVEPKP